MRKNYFIKKRFQMSFLARFVLLTAVEACLIFAFLMIMSSDTITTGYQNSGLKVERTASFFFLPTALIVLIIGVAIALAGSIVFIYYSHSLAGPLYRLQKDINTIATGDLTIRTNMRKTDQLQEIKESLNNMTFSFDKRVSMILDIITDTKRSIHKTYSPENFVKVIQRFDKIENELRKFRTSENKKD